MEALTAEQYIHGHDGHYDIITEAASIKRNAADFGNYSKGECIVRCN